MGVELVSFEELLAESDFVSIHLPKNKETLGLFEPRPLAKCKPGVRIINTARGGIIDEEALAEAIRSGHIGGAGLDVFAKEPTTESPLFELPQVVVTPHLGASTDEAQDKAGVTIAEQVQLALAGDFVPYAVNVAAGDVSDVVRPFMGLAEQLGRFFGGLHDRTCPTARDRVPGRAGGGGHGDPHALGPQGALRGRPATSRSPTSTRPQLAETRGLRRGDARRRRSSDYVNLITLRSAEHTVSGTLTSVGLQVEPRIVIVDDHVVEVPPSPTCSWSATTTVPGVIGIVGTALGAAGHLHLVDGGRARARSRPPR